VNLALEGLVAQSVPGAKILDLCEFGHTVMDAQAGKLYNKKVDGKLIDRGVAFPVCISVNDVVCNHSPLATEETVSFSFSPFIHICKYCPVQAENKCITRMPWMLLLLFL
jgi:methionine aminopeptidase